MTVASATPSAARAATGGAAPVAAATPAARGDEPRLVIAVSDATPEEHRDTEDPIALLVEMPLQHLGLVVRRWPVDAGPPPAAWLAEARGVVTWLGTRPSPAGEAARRRDWLAPWLLEDVVGRGIRLVVLGEPAELEDDPHAWHDLLAAFGLAESGAWSADPLLVEVELADPARCALEAPVVQPVHRGARPSAAARAWVTTRVPSDPDPAVPVLTGAFGGIALNPFVAATGADSGGLRLHLDLSAYLREALALEGLPVFDPAVVNGRRVFFCQVDGDGFESLSTVRSGEPAAAVFLSEVVDRFELPFTIGLIAASVTGSLDGSDGDPRLALARTLLTRPNVEPASHGVLHTLRWSEPLLADSPPRTVAWYAGLGGYTYSARAEVTESLPFVDRLLAGTGRRAEVMLWTGDAIPEAAPLAATRELGVANVNGGTYRWDAANDSLGYVRPHVRLEGDELQVFCGGPNENVYDGFFDRHPGAFRHVATTLARTGAPRILKPANVYIHLYAAERPERLASIQDLLQRFGVDEDTAPVFASEYWGLAHDAFTGARVARVADPAPGAVCFRLRGHGRCRTVRFDDEAREVDLAASAAVLGSRRLGGALYVHLAPESPTHETVVRLVDSAAAARERRPHLVEADHVLHAGARTAAGLAWRARSVAPRHARLAGFTPGEPLTVRVGSAETMGTADERGEYTLTLGPGDDAVEVARR